MPLIRIDSVKGGARLALWEMTERTADLQCPPDVDLASFRSEARLKERLTTYAMLKELTGNGALFLSHERSSKPVLEGYEISISHTRGWAAVILSTDRPVAVDVEYRSDRVTRVADRFIRPDEDKSSLDIQLVNWSVKETVYKLLSAENLHYGEMRLQQFAPLARGKVWVEDLKCPKIIEVEYLLTSDYVLTWAVLD